MPDLNSQPEIIRRQYDLQHDIISSLLSLDDDAITDEAVREKVKSFRLLCMEIQSAPVEALSVASETGGPESDIWGQIIAELVRQGAEAIFYWFNPGQQAALYNATDSAILVRTYDERDGWRWVPYGTYTINPNQFTIVYARGQNNFQVDIQGRVSRVDIGAAYAYDGNRVIRRP